MLEETDGLALRLTRSEPAARGIQRLEFRDSKGTLLPPFTPGAHIAVRVPNGALRNYSLCNDPAERDRYVITVKREDSGRGGSVSLIDHAHLGDILRSSAPRDTFALVPAPRYIFVAGGIGITPLMAMLHALRAAGDRPFHLYYLTRDAAGTAFHAELSAPPFRDRATIHHDEGDPSRGFDLWPLFEAPSDAHIYCCGPRPLMNAVRDMTGHWDTTRVHFEDFGADLVRPRTGDAPFAIRLGLDGPVLDVPVGVTILDIVRAHGRRVATSCESGTCGTCRTTVLAGEPDHRDRVLTQTERKREIMICVSRATSPELVLDL